MSYSFLLGESCEGSQSPPFIIHHDKSHQEELIHNERKKRDVENKLMNDPSHSMPGLIISSSASVALIFSQDASVQLTKIISNLFTVLRYLEVLIVLCVVCEVEIVRFTISRRNADVRALVPLQGGNAKQHYPAD